MADNLESDIKYVPYKELAKKRSLDYYYANKEAISLKRKDKYKQLSPKDKKKLLQYNRQWFNNQSPERQLELRQKTRKYHKNRYEGALFADQISIYYHVKLCVILLNNIFLLKIMFKIIFDI